MEKEQLYKACPYCGEMVPADEVQCPVCKELIINSNEEENSSLKPLIISLVIVIGCCLLVGGFYLYWTHKSIFSNNFNGLFQNQTVVEKPVEKTKKSLADYNASDYYELGKEKAAEGKFEEAMGNYQEALLKDPSLKEVNVAMVKLCIENYDTACVKEYIKPAYEYAPADITLKFYYAVECDDYEKAISLLKDVVGRDPNHYMANRILGNNYANSGEYKIALKYLKKAYENRNSHEKYAIDTDGLVEDWKALAITHIKLDEYTNAINILDKVIAATNDSDARSLKNYAEQQRENYLYNQSREEYLRQNGYYNNYNRNNWDY